jgi:Spermine/spermidine synthase domain
MGQLLTAEATPAPTPVAAKSPTAQLTRSLFVISVLGLFLELLLIRWVTTEIRIFAYLQNTVLVVCFLGLGMGCWASRKPFALRDVLSPLLVLGALLAIPVTRVVLGRISDMLSDFTNLLIWETGSSTDWERKLAGPIGLGLTLVLMVLIWDIFVPIGRLLGQLLDEHPRPIFAYSVNVAGSLVGIWLFVLLSVLRLPPVVWFAVVGLLALYFLPSGKGRRIDLILLGSVVVCGWLGGREPGSTEVIWSPYQKLTLRKVDPNAHEDGGVLARIIERKGLFGPQQGSSHGLLVTINNAGYQVMADLRPETLARRAAEDPKNYPPEQLGYSQYDVPPLLHPNPKKMLIVGAGSGNDVAGGLRNGVDEVVGVEIDPAIIDFGRRYHPEQPYSSPKVRIINDDARSFFANSSEKFDLIVFGLLDSHTTTAMTNARLDHYVYTRESLQQARALLAEGGIVFLSFEAQKEYMSDRMVRSLQEVFGQAPICFRMPFNGYGWGGAAFVVGNIDAVRKRIAEQPRLAGLIDKWQRDYPFDLPGTARVATDDWPYIYLETPHVPVLYYLLAAILVVLFLRGMRKLQVSEAIRGWGRTSWHFFFLGAAFMLLETQNISKAAVVLGNTWLVNAVIITGILAMVLLSNAIAARLPRLPIRWVYAALVAACVGLYFVDLAVFNPYPYAAKALIVGALTSVPMLFSGIVFIRSFANAAHKDAALGANLMGALVGGLLQTVTFVTGIKALLLIVAFLYLAASLSRPRTASAEAAQPAVATA